MPYTNPAPETVETFWSDGFDARSAPPVVQEFTPPHDALAKGAGTLCRCESIDCEHGQRCCSNLATKTVPTMFGNFEMCAGCAANMPSQFLKDGGR